MLKRKRYKLEGNNYNYVMCPAQREETVSTYSLAALLPQNVGAGLEFSGRWMFLSSG
jgi:hypothetical protein